MKLLRIPMLLAACWAASSRAAMPVDPTPWIERFRTSNGIEGCAVTIWNGSGTIVYQKGFGSAGFSPYTPDTPTRVASVSKGITGIIAMQAVNEGKLKLDTPINEYLKYPKLGDKRIESVTMRQLLQHVSGFGSDNTFITSPGSIGTRLPLSNKDIVDWAMTKKFLVSTPGTSYAYSNLGYAIIVQVLEKATGESYGDYSKKVLARYGLTKTFLGSTLRGADGEASYFDRGNRQSSAQYGGNPLPFPYGGAFVLENMPAGGGWVSSSNDLARLMTQFFRNNQSVVLAKPVGLSNTYYTGLGWNVNAVNDVFRVGSLECSSACVVWLHNGWGFSFVCNTASNQDKSTGGFGVMFHEQFTDWVYKNLG